MGVSALFRSVGPKALQATPLKQWVNRSSLAVAATTECSGRRHRLHLFGDIVYTLAERRKRR